ncbi:MAG: hypothetical protein WBM50_26725 [Acidimicrobiales bacterium]
MRRNRRTLRGLDDHDAVSLEGELYRFARTPAPPAIIPAPLMRSISHASNGSKAKMLRPLTVIPAPSVDC